MTSIMKMARVIAYAHLRTLAIVLSFELLGNFLGNPLNVNDMIKTRPLSWRFVVSSGANKSFENGSDKGLPTEL